MITGRLYSNNEIVTLQITDGIITGIKGADARISTGQDTYIAPGLIDTQVNGYSSISFGQDKLTTKEVRKVTEAMWKEGVTTYFPTVVSSPHERIKTSFSILAEANEKDAEIRQSVPGFFLEGPYISPIDGFRGAHNKDYVRLPDWEEFTEYVKASNNQIILVGVAPEMEGAISFIQKCKNKGITVALAHHNGNADIIHEAVNNGATVSTHLGNGCANMINRHNNPLWPQLAEERLTPSLIVDGHHLRPEEVKTFLKVKGPDNIMLVSDATMLAGMPPGTYNWDGKTVVMTEDGMLKYPEQNVLAGASFPIRYGVFNVMKFTGCSLEEAITMASTTPANTFNLDDRGAIEVGKRADIILFKLENDQMKIEKTFLAGNLVYSADN
ncbi:N-acetylglucosamine-6-phosphate deacetylase [Bacteroidota bacterium]